MFRRYLYYQKIKNDFYFSKIILFFTKKVSKRKQKNAFNTQKLG